VIRYVNLDAELRDVEALRGLVLAGLVEMSNCAYPKTHVMRTAPFFDTDGQLCCRICREIAANERWGNS
jgi:hypothetical protein